MENIVGLDFGFLFCRLEFHDGINDNSVRISCVLIEYILMIDVDTEGYCFGLYDYGMINSYDLDYSTYRFGFNQGKLYRRNIRRFNC